MITLEDIEQARARLAAIVRATPLEHSDNLSSMVGRALWLKPEHRQLTGSYKIRGAYNKISRLDEGVEVVAASAGNHAQGVARAARLTHRKATIFMPEAAPLPKVAATRADGADVRLEGVVVDESIAAARAYAEQTGAAFIHPFDDPLIVAGQGTVGLEIAAEAPNGATVVVPIGGGGLISGVSAALKAARPDIRVVGAQAAGAAAMDASLRAGHEVTLDRLATIADGIAVKSVSRLTLDHVKAFVDDIVIVTDDEISRALVLLLERAKAVVEPAGAIALAAILSGKVAASSAAIAVLSGGNVDPLLLIKLIEHGLTAAGRYLVLRVVLEDRPGALASLTQAVAELGLNVLEVEHHRVGVQLVVDKVEVMLTLETRDPGHRDDAVKSLRARGFSVELLA
jgi:threonine dehydratase